MAIDRSKPLSEITFYCKPCYQSFKAEPERIEEAPEQEFHPFEYFAPCLRCGDECAQAHWEKNLLKAYSKATGPKTEDGKAASAANLEGHPTKEEALRTRFNAMKHGLSARTATYFPPKPDAYSFCQGCDVDRVHCSRQPACVKKTELFMLHHAAFDQRNPKHLMGIYADLQASVFAILQSILQTIVADGVKLEAPQYYVDKETNKLIVAEYIDEKGERRIIKDIEAHPLFRPLGEMLSRANLSLSDMGMTQKVIEAEESELGRLAGDQAEQESIEEYRKRTLSLLSGMADKIQRSNQQTNSDPKLIEYQQEGGA